MNFQINQDELVHIVKLYQDKIGRNQGNQIRFLEKKGGIKYLLRSLYTHPNKGIRKTSITQRINQFGSNQKQLKQINSIFSFFWRALDDFILKILIVSALCQLIIQTAMASGKDRNSAWIDGFSILLAVLVCALVTAINDYQKEIQFQKLNQITQNRKMVNVTRQNQLLSINQNEVVTGDIVNIRQGMEIPVDGWLIQSNQIYVDQSSMTGESEAVAKNTYQYSLQILKKHQQQKNSNQIIDNNLNLPSPIILSGTKVYGGQGKMVCLLVGKYSSLGKISKLIDLQKQQLTPLQTKLQKLAADIGKFGVYSALMILIALLIRFIFQKLHDKIWVTAQDLPVLLNYFLLAVTVIVVAIPEGLPLAVTLTLAYSVKKMLMDNNLVRRMEACETMGGANIICSDKTGTLTMNKMSICCWWNGELMDVQSYNQITLQNPNMKEQFKQLLLMNIFINSSSQLRPQINGSATQIALMTFGERFEQKYELYRSKYTLFAKFPFNSTRKRMSVLVEDGKKGLKLFTKGATEIILKCCVKYYKYDSGQNISIDAQYIKKIEKIIQQMAEKGLRTILLAYKELSYQNQYKKNKEGIYDIQTQNLILLAILGVRDLPRPEVSKAISQCKRAGIKIKMVTGDNLITAVAIAKQIGIITPNNPSLCMQGIQFNKIIGGIVCANCRTEKCDCTTDIKDKNKMLRKDVIKNEQQFARLTKHLDVLARSRPQDKYALVTGLINLGNIVAVTGDGTNDAPALRKADVGFAMGKSGTEVARQASSIVLLDDNFNSIVKSVIWGRNIYDSIKKFIQFQLTVNIVAVCIALTGAVFLKQSILPPIQMLWVNMIMDSLASLALATESPSQQLLDRLPYRRDEYLITKKMWKNILFQVCYQLIILIILIFWGQLIITEEVDEFDKILGYNNLIYKYKDGIVQNGHVVSGRLYNIFTNIESYKTIFNKYSVYSRHFTFIFNTFVFLQIFNFFNCRKLKDQINIFQGITQNWIFLLVLFIIIVLQILIVTFGGIAFQLYIYYGLNRNQWILSVAFGFGSLFVSAIGKLFPESKLCLQNNEKQQEIKFKQNRAYGLAIRKKIRGKQEDILQSEKMMGRI